MFKRAISAVLIPTLLLLAAPALAGAIAAGKPPPVKFVTGGIRELAHGKLPGGQTFTIIGERYRFEGRFYFSLAFSINRPGTPPGVGGVPGPPPGGNGGGSFNPSESPGVLVWNYFVACAPPYALAYGLLRAPSDSVRAREGHRTTVLRHVSIPAVLHAGGVLVYASLAGPPSELIVRRPDGKRVLDDNLPTLPTNCQPPGLVAFG
jgi:hypothetical protein